MGALVSCFYAAEETKRRPPPRRRSAVNAPPTAAGGIGSSERWSKGRSGRKERAEEALIHEQALAAAAALLAQQNGGPLPLDRSSSLRYPGHGQKKQSLTRSSSSRARSLTDPVVQPQQLVNQLANELIGPASELGALQMVSEPIRVCRTEHEKRITHGTVHYKDLKIDNLETHHFVLVHGGGFGAWCWYKTIALLEDTGFKVNAIDLTGSGIHSFDTNKITSLPEYVQPLTSFLETLGDGEKVILVGHDFGGACISFAMEMFPSKIAKAVFLCAAMLTNGQSILDIFSQQADTNNLTRQAQIFVYANGNDHSPTAINLDKSSLKELLFNQSPAKDVALALVSMRPIPFAPVLEKLSLTDNYYGSVRRFYIEATEDNAIPLSLQQSICGANPPERVFRLKGSDHSPFFSKPQALNKLLVEISKITSPQVQ